MGIRPVPLSDARVLIVGAGGLGAPAALYLASAGIGHITLVDFDTVDESNLQRQILFSTDDVGRPKLASAAKRLCAFNPGLRLHLVEEPFGPANGLDLVRQVDVVIDGTDSFAARYLVNDAAVLAGRPNVFGSVHRFEGQAAVFAMPGGPCYRCLHPEPPPSGLVPTCADAGVLGVLPGVIGMIQALEAIKLLTGVGRPLAGRLLLYDALRMRARDILLPRDPACAACGDAPTITELVSYEVACVPGGSAGGITAEELSQWRRTGRPHALIDVREPAEHAAHKIEGSVLIPLGRLRAELTLIPRDRPVVVHCKSGWRSGQAADLLRSLGVDARSLLGGLQAWARLDQRVETHK